MSACKNTKPELIAIYRLEFYKKQNNWKLSPTRKEKKSEKSSEKKKNLNVTYNLDQHDIAERSDPLNVAFVDSDSEKTAQTKLLSVSDQRNKELSQEWLEPVNIWPSTVPSEDTPKSSTVDKEKSLMWNINTDSNDNWVERINSTQKLKTCTRRRLEELQKAARSQEITSEQPNDGDGFEDDCREASWGRNVDSKWKTDCYQDLKTDAGIVLDSGHTAQDIWTQAPETDVPDGLDYPDVINPEDWRPRLIDGAHWASEKLRNMASMNSFSGGSFDEYPTRDIGPYDLGNRDDSCVNRHIFYNDVFLAGSYKNVCAEERGRGRGRLNETSLWR